jgi:gas vesicle protein
MENSRNTEKVVAALLIGAAIGGALGIIFASEKGAELRKMMAAKTGDLSQSLKETFTSLIDASKKKFEEAKETNTVLASNVREN